MGMVKTIILIFGIALIALGGQDLIRILINPQDPGLWGGVTNEYLARVILNSIIIAAGITDTAIATGRIKTNISK